MFYLRRWQRFGERVGHHVFSWAINQPDGTLFDHPANEVETHIDVLGAGMVLIVAGECNGRLVVAQHRRWVLEGAEDVCEEAAWPQRLLHTVCRCDILALGGG